MHTVWVITSIALVGIGGAWQSLTGDCLPDISFEADGSIGRWHVCQSGVERHVVTDSSSIFDISVRLEDQSGLDELEWTNNLLERADRSESKAAVGEQIELNRTLRRLADSRVEMELSVVNQSSSIAPPLTLVVSLGAAIGNLDGGPKSLADRLYTFDKLSVRQPDGSWQIGAGGSRASVIASQSRAFTVIFDATRDGVLAQVASGAAESMAKRWHMTFEVEELAPGDSWSLVQEAIVMPSTSSALEEEGYDNLLYSEIWAPLATLSRATEKVIALFGTVLGSMGGAVICFALAVRVATLPVTRWARQQQERFDCIQEKMSEPISQIRQNYKGAEQSERILQLYKEHRISPFSGLKGSLALFVQIPFLLAFFQVTTYAALFHGESFLWIADLSQADSLAALPITIPMLGNQINLLPILLLVVNGVSVRREIVKTRKIPVGMILFIVFIVMIFYSFCAAIVLYWVVINAIQLVERAVFDRIDSRSLTGVDP